LLYRSLEELEQVVTGPGEFEIDRIACLSRRPTFAGKMTLQVDAIMENSADVHLSFISDSINREVAGPLDLSERLPDAVLAVTEMISAGSLSNLRTGETAGSLMIVGHVHRL
jgi:hypothetical protein